MPVLMITGLISLLLGIVLFFVWFGYILALIKAVLPLVFIIGGAVASYLGWEELRERRSGPAIDFSSPDEASRYKAEAKAYQEKLNEIKVDPSAFEAESQANDPPQNADDVDTAVPEAPSLAGNDESR